MAYPKRLNAINRQSQDRAVESHAGFVSFVSGKVKKEGLQNVLSSQRNDSLYWLKKSYERVLNFAEQVQLKRIPQQITGEEGGPIPVIAYLPIKKDA
jgi:hypothetical protein